MKKLLVILVIVLGSCTKAMVQECYICTFGTIKVGNQSWNTPDEVHCEPGAENYKKYLTVPGTVINNWQFPTSCKLK